MSVLVTGGAGYVGLNVVQALLARGERVVLLDAGAMPAAAQRALAPHAANLDIVRADVCDAAAVGRAFEGRAIGGVIHCAAVTAGRVRETNEPASSIDVNLHGTLNVLDAARRNKVRRVVYPSSGAVYGESLTRLARIYEDSAPAAPVTLYAITKYATERMCVRLRELWQLDVVCARLGTLVGPWERATGARDNFGTHTQLARCALRGEAALLPREPVRRDWVYSRDVAAGLLALLEGSPRYTVYNLSAGCDWAGVLEWCALLKRAYPRFVYHAARENETPNIGHTDGDRYPMDIGRIAQDVGFRPRTAAAAFADFLDWMARTPDFWE
jgi:nucleoside-diphosphate-sugar epimerase